MLPTLLQIIKCLEAEQTGALQWVNQQFETIEDGHFSAIAINDKEFSLMPYPEFSAMIYRGQSQYYNPCLPSFYRDRPTKIERFILEARLAEFMLLLKDHPAVKDCFTWSIMGHRLRVDYEALAQHYHLMTRLLDFSSNGLVAAFFACTEFDSISRKYIPIVNHRNRPGVIYSLNAAGDMVLPSNNNQTGTVGLQPLPRPAEQYAWGFRLSGKASLNSQPLIRIYQFRHSPEDSIKVFDSFDGGEKLFPYDPVLGKAQQIGSTKNISIEAFELALQKQRNGLKKKSLLNDLRRKKIEIVNEREVIISPQEYADIDEDWKKRRNYLFSRIHWRRVAYPL